MMRRAILPTLGVLLLPVAAWAQQGTVTYDRAVQYDFELPEGLEARAGIDIPTANVTSMILLFDGSESILTPAPTEEDEAPARVSDVAEVQMRVQMLMTRLRLGSASRSDQETLLETYVSHEKGTVAETREFMGRTFRITDSQPSWAWRLTGEEGEFLGYRVQKATAEQDSTTVEAWFTPEIPVAAGPGGFGGLPGLILVVSVNDGHTQYTATEVKLEPLEAGAIQAPQDGDEVSREEYEAVVAEKLEELRATQRRRGGGDRRDGGGGG